MREIGRHVHQFGPKLTPENINNFGQKFCTRAVLWEEKYRAVSARSKTLRMLPYPLYQKL